MRPLKWYFPTRRTKTMLKLIPASICNAAPVMKLIVSDIVPGVSTSQVFVENSKNHWTSLSLGFWLYLTDIASLELGWFCAWKLLKNCPYCFHRLQLSEWQVFLSIKKSNVQLPSFHLHHFNWQKPSGCIAMFFSSPCYVDPRLLKGCCDLPRLDLILVYFRYPISTWLFVEMAGF